MIRRHRLPVVLAGVAALSVLALPARAAAAAGPTGPAPTVPAPADSTAAAVAAVVERATGTAALAPAAVGLAGVPESSGRPATAVGSTGVTVSIDLPDTRDVPGVRAGRGTTVYVGAAPATDLAVQATDGGGIRALTVLKDATAPREYRYGIGLPEGARLVPLDGGAVAAVAADGRTVLGGFAAPWAEDADGRTVPTRYRVEGDTLVQTVDVGPGTAFPVTADPWYNPLSWKLPDYATCVSKEGMAGMATGMVGGAFVGGIGAGPGAFVGGLSGMAGGLVSC
ncbi:hypothetical protein AB0O91_28665 [Kitasatospora sp. NPDC089797]|uniref:hypothetical protein n=1 Tax=Kitasatospora sp. NPDC089797 TaxID=3155298 RepID=UPI0034480C32